MEINCESGCFLSYSFSGLETVHLLSSFPVMRIALELSLRIRFCVHRLSGTQFGKGFSMLIIMDGRKLWTLFVLAEREGNL